MTVRRRRLAGALVSLTLLGIVTGCSQEQSGLASPEMTESGDMTSSGNPPNQDGVGVADPVDPCSLFSEDEMAQHGDFEPPVENTIAGYPNCEWSVPGESAGDTDAPIVNMTYREDLGVTDVVDLGDGIRSGQTETGRQLVMTTGVNEVMDTPTCLIGMETGPSSRLVVQVGRTPEPCELAEQLVEKADTKLPQG